MAVSQFSSQLKVHFSIESGELKNGERDTIPNNLKHN